MLNCVMLVKNRRLLTKQAIETLILNTRSDFTLTIVDDGSDFRMQTTLNLYHRERMKVIHVNESISNTALLRNFGVYFSCHYFGQGDYLYLSDNDAYFTNGWDTKMFDAWSGLDQFKLLGPYRHPYHIPTSTVPNNGYDIAVTDAVQGIGHLMTWDTWDKYGPLDEHAGDGLGTNQSEDHTFCRRIVDDGYLVGCLQPNVVLNCGLTGTSGKPSPGIEYVEKQKVEGVYYE